MQMSSMVPELHMVHMPCYAKRLLQQCATLTLVGHALRRHAEQQSLVTDVFSCIYVEALP